MSKYRVKRVLIKVGVGGKYCDNVIVFMLQKRRFLFFCKDVKAFKTRPTADDIVTYCNECEHKK